MSRRFRSLLVTLCAAVVAVVAVAAGQPALAGNAGTAVSGVPNTFPPNSTPDFNNGAVNAITQIGDRVYLGGTFTSLTADGTSQPLPWLVAVNRTTGALDPTFRPSTTLLNNGS